MLCKRRLKRLSLKLRKQYTGEDDAKSLLEVLNKCYINLVERRQGVDNAILLSVFHQSME